MSQKYIDWISFKIHMGLKIKTKVLGKISFGFSQTPNVRKNSSTKCQTKNISRSPFSSHLVGWHHKYGTSCLFSYSPKFKQYESQMLIEKLWKNIITLQMKMRSHQFRVLLLILTASLTIHSCDQLVLCFICARVCVAYAQE